MGLTSVSALRNVLKKSFTVVLSSWNFGHRKNTWSASSGIPLGIVCSLFMTKYVWVSFETVISCEHLLCEVVIVFTTLVVYPVFYLRDYTIRSSLFRRPCQRNRNNFSRFHRSRNIPSARHVLYMSRNRSAAVLNTVIVLYWGSGLVLEAHCFLLCCILRSFSRVIVFILLLLYIVSCVGKRLATISFNCSAPAVILSWLLACSWRLTLPSTAFCYIW